MKNLIASTQAGFDSLSDVDKDALKLAGRLFGQAILFKVVQVTVVHAYGRKIAPNVFKSWGRTYAVVSLIKAATGRLKPSEEDKKAIASIKERQAEQKLAEIRRATL